MFAVTQQFCMFLILLLALIFILSNLPSLKFEDLMGIRVERSLDFMKSLQI